MHFTAEVAEGAEQSAEESKGGECGQDDRINKIGWRE